MKKTTTKKTPAKRGRPAKKNRATKAKLKAGTPVKAARKRPKKVAKRRAKKRNPDEMHDKRCNVCKSKYREQIEERFIGWQAVTDIVADYPGVSESGVTRHLKAMRLFAKRDMNRKGRLRAMINDAHNRGIKIESGPEYLRALELEARQHGDLVEKIDVTGNINIKSNDELAERADKIKRRAFELAASRTPSGT